MSVNQNPEQADSDNLFTPLFTEKAGATLTAAYERSFSTCSQTRRKLENNPVRLVKDLYRQSVKKNDTQIRLGNVKFHRLSAKRLYTNEASPLSSLIATNT